LYLSSALVEYPVCALKSMPIVPEMSTPPEYVKADDEYFLKVEPAMNHRQYEADGGVALAVVVPPANLLTWVW